jgi:hypothetical protein
VCAVPRMAMEDEHLKNWAGEHEGELWDLWETEAECWKERRSSWAVREGGATVARPSRKSGIPLPARVCGRSREDLLLVRESDHGNPKTSALSFSQKVWIACWVLFQTFLIRFLLPYFLGRIFSWWVASSSPPHFRAFWMPNNNNHKFERYWESRVWLDHLLLGLIL